MLKIIFLSFYISNLFLREHAPSHPQGEKGEDCGLMAMVITDILWLAHQTCVTHNINLFIDETDEEDEEQPRRRRRLAERAADGDMQDEDEVQGINTLLKIILVIIKY